MYGSQNLIVFGFQSSGGGTPTPVNTIYNADDTIVGNRILNANGNTVTFLDTSVFRINTSINPIASRATFQVDGVGTTSSISIEKISSQLGVARETYADRNQQFYGNLGINTSPNPNSAIDTQGTFFGAIFRSTLYGVYGEASGGYADFLSVGGNKAHGFYSSQIPNGAAFKSENPSGGSGVLKTGFLAGDFGTNDGGINIGFSAGINAVASTNKGFSANVLGGLNNYAFEIISGDFKTPNGIGLTETLTFGGGTSGDVASLTFEKGMMAENLANAMTLFESSGDLTGYAVNTLKSKKGITVVN